MYLDLLADFLESPARAARQAGENRPLGLGLLGFSLAGLSLFLAQSLTHPFLLLPSRFWAFGFLWVYQVTNGFILAAVLHFIVESLGGRGGNAGGLFVLLGLSELVWTLVLPAVLVLKLLSLESRPAVALLLFATGLACMTLKARCIRDAYGVGTAKAWLAALSPYIAASILGAALVMLAVAGLVVSVSRLLH